jgi:hypothetical protein
MGTERGLHFESGDNTYWAPEVLWAEGRYHMFVSCIRGVPDRWDGHSSATVAGPRRRSRSASGGFASQIRSFRTNA